jgi:hypothetical protein
MASDAEKLVQQLAQRARLQETFAGYALSIYQQVERLSSEGLAAQLGCTLTGVEQLALCQRPTGQPDEYRAKVLAIAALVGADPDRLGQLFRAVDAALRLRAAEAANTWDSSVQRRAARRGNPASE